MISEDINMDQGKSNDVNVSELANKLKNTSICPCCKQPTLKKPVKVNNELMDQWMTCLVTGAPFSRAYKLYDGRLIIVVSQLDADDLLAARKCLDLLDSLAKLDFGQTNGEDIDIAALKMGIQTYSCIKKIELSTKNGTGKVFTPKDYTMDCVRALVKHTHELSVSTSNPNDWRELLTQCIGKMNDNQLVSNIPCAILMSTVETHIKLSDMLLEAGFDDSFWKGIELA